MRVGQTGVRCIIYSRDALMRIFISAQKQMETGLGFRAIAERPNLTAVARTEVPKIFLAINHVLIGDYFAVLGIVYCNWFRHGRFPSRA